MQNPVRFTSGIAALLVAAVSGIAAEPPLQAPRVIEQPIWAYPIEVSQQHIFEGKTQVLVSISEEGQLLDFIVLGFTHPAFAKEVSTNLPRFRFAPGRVRGEAATTRVPITFHFEQQGNVISTTASEQIDQHLKRLMLRNKYTATVCPGAKLDRPLQPSVVVSPEYPSELRARRVAGDVTVDFYVDAEGRVRMPATAASAHPSFSRTAIGAVEQWRFEPPTSMGEPVLVHVQQQFRFLPPPEIETKAAEENRQAAAAPSGEARSAAESNPRL